MTERTGSGSVSQGADRWKEHPRFLAGCLSQNTVDGCEIHFAPRIETMEETMRFGGIFTVESNHSRVF